MVEEEQGRTDKGQEKLTPEDFGVTSEGWELLENLNLDDVLEDLEGVVEKLRGRMRLKKGAPEGSWIQQNLSKILNSNPEIKFKE